MKFVDTRDGCEISISIFEAILSGKVSRGLLTFKNFPKKFERGEIENLNFCEIAKKVLRKFFTILEFSEIEKIANGAFNSQNFTDDEIVPFFKFDENLFSAQMWHGKTAAFKDIALSALPHFFEIALRKSAAEKVLILGATSGDTGSAGEAGFENFAQSFLAILFPQNGRVSEIQKNQILNLQNERISAFAIDANFDFCQNEIVKKILNNENFKREIFEKFKTKISTLNSINIGRIIFQTISFLKFSAENYAENFIAVIPTGNFGHAFSAFCARKLGARISRICVATNENDGLFEFFENGKFALKNFQTTNSPSMDIAIASNLERILFHFFGAARTDFLMENLQKKGAFELSENELKNLREIFCARRVSQNETLHEIKKFFDEKKYLLDPHSAIAARAAREFQNEKVLFLETAHWGKFPATVLESGVFADEKFPKNEIEKMQKINEILREKNLNPRLPRFLKNLNPETKPPKKGNFKPTEKEFLEILRNLIL